MHRTALDQVLEQRQSTSHDIVNVDEPVTKLVIFSLGDAWFAFHGDRIREILSHAEVFFVPGCPASLEGVINVRGDIESVIQPHSLLHLPTAARERGTCILLAQGGGMRSGIRVDRVVDVIDVPNSRIAVPPGTLAEPMRQLALGVLEFKKQSVVLLDLDKMFADYARGLG
ncbi:MAG: chemotaxis protein CheW [Rhodoferax sp.]|nr:chemotaxis protein CheW [Rhodoferax sp.]